MSGILKLSLSGNIGDSVRKVYSSYSWPLGKPHREVEEIIKKFKQVFCNVSVVIEHDLID